MFVQVRASNPPHAGTYTPGRFWANGVTHRLEVVADSISEAQLKPERVGHEDPATRKLHVASGPFMPDGKTPDPARITESGLVFIKGNPHMSVLGDGETQGSISQAAVDAARAAASKANAELTDATIEISVLNETIETLTKANAELTAKVAELEAKAATPPEPKGKGKSAKDETTEPAK